MRLLQAWLCCTSLLPTQCRSLQPPERPGAPSSGQKVLGSTGAAAELSLWHTGLVPAGDSGSRCETAALGTVPAAHLSES